MKHDGVFERTIIAFWLNAKYENKKSKLNKKFPVQTKSE